MPPTDEEKAKAPEEEPHVKVDQRAARRAAEEHGCFPCGGSSEAEEPVEREADEEEKPGEPEAEELPEVSIYSLLRMFVGMVMQQAWVHLGVQMDQTKQKVQQDLPKAKTAIDTLASLVAHLQPDLEATEKRELERALADLRINYTRRV